MQGGNTLLLAGANHPDRSRAAASGLGAEAFGIPPAPPSLTPRRRRRPGLPLSRGMRLRHLGNSSVRCGVQYAKPAPWRSAGVAEEGASDPVLHVGDRVGVRRGYLGSSILPGAFGPKVEAFRPCGEHGVTPPQRYSDLDCARTLRSCSSVVEPAHPIVLTRVARGRDTQAPHDGRRFKSDQLPCIARRTPLAPARDTLCLNPAASLRVCGPSGAEGYRPQTIGQ